MSRLGKDCVFKLDNVGGSLQDLTADGMNVNTSWNRDDHDVTKFGASGHQHKPGLQNNTFTAEFDYSDTIYSHLTGLRGSDNSYSFEIYPKGTTSTYPKETGECFLTNLQMGRDPVNPMKIQASFVVDGTVAFGTAT
jgi:hypothetical protein